MFRTVYLLSDLHTAKLYIELIFFKRILKYLVSIRVRPSPKVDENFLESIHLQPNSKQHPGCIFQQKNSSASAKVFNEASTNEKVYNEGIKPIINKFVVEGNNCAVIAYGQSCSGKTHTIHGRAASGKADDEPGVISFIANDIFRNIENQKHRYHYIVRASHIDVCNEEIRDLLRQNYLKGEGIGELAKERVSQLVTLRDDARRGIALNCAEVIVRNSSAITNLAEEGHRNVSLNTMHVHNHHHQTPSKSHTIFRITLERREKKESKSSFISSDMEGSSDDDYSDRRQNRRIQILKDRAKSDGNRRGKNEGICVSILNIVDVGTLNEISSSNRNFFSLSNALINFGNLRQTAPVDFRESKLTRILQPSLSKNALVALIGCISNDKANIEKSIVTLDLAKRILNQYESEGDEIRKSQASIQARIRHEQKKIESKEKDEENLIDLHHKSEKKATQATSRARELVNIMKTIAYERKDDDSCLHEDLTSKALQCSNQLKVLILQDTVFQMEEKNPTMGALLLDTGNEHLWEQEPYNEKKDIDEQKKIKSGMELNSTVDDLHGTQMQSSTTISELIGNLTSARDEIKTLKDGNEVWKNCCKEINLEKRRWEDEARRLSEENFILINETKALKEKLSSSLAQDKNSENNEDNDSALTKEIDINEGNIHNQPIEAAIFENLHPQNDTYVLIAEKNAAVEDKNNLLNEIEKMKIEHTQLHQKITKLTEDRDAIFATKNLLELEVKVLQRKMARCSNEHDHLKEEHVDNRNKVTCHAKEVNIDINSALDHSSKGINQNKNTRRLKAERDTYLTQRDALVEECSLLIIERNEAASQNEELHQLLNDCHTQIIHLEKQLKQSINKSTYEIPRHTVNEENKGECNLDIACEESEENSDYGVIECDMGPGDEPSSITGENETDLCYLFAQMKNLVNERDYFEAKTKELIEERGILRDNVLQVSDDKKETNKKDLTDDGTTLLEVISFDRLSSEKLELLSQEGGTLKQKAQSAAHIRKFLELSKTVELEQISNNNSRNHWNQPKISHEDTNIALRRQVSELKDSFKERLRCTFPLAKSNTSENLSDNTKKKIGDHPEYINSRKGWLFGTLCNKPANSL